MMVRVKVWWIKDWSIIRKERKYNFLDRFIYYYKIVDHVQIEGSVINDPLKYINIFLRVIVQKKYRRNKNEWSRITNIIWDIVRRYFINNKYKKIVKIYLVIRILKWIKLCAKKYFIFKTFNRSISWLLMYILKKYNQV